MRVIIEAIGDGIGGNAQVLASYWNGTTPIGVYGSYFSLSAVNSRQDLVAAAEAAVTAYAVAQSYTLSEGIIWACAQDIDLLEFYNAGTPVLTPKVNVGSVAIAGGAGLVTFYLTDTGAAGGNALFANVNLDSIQPFIPDSSASYAFSAPSYNSTTKALTLTVNKLGTSTTNVLLNLLGSLTSVLTGITYAAAPNGTVVKMMVWGN